MPRMSLVGRLWVALPLPRNSDCCLQCEPQTHELTLFPVPIRKPDTTDLTCKSRVFPTMKMLCKRCSQIFRGPCSHGEQDHYFKVRDLEWAAYNNCHICRVLWQAMSDEAPKNVGLNPTEGTSQRDVLLKPISKYHMRHKVLYTNEISELSFVIDRNGVLNGGRAFLFCLQNTSGKSKAMLMVAKCTLIS